MKAITLLGEAWLLLCGAVWLVLFALSMVGIPWSLTALLIVLVLVSLPAIRHLPSAIQFPRLAWPNAIDLITLALIGGYLKLATVSSPVETDYITIWGLEGKEFWLHRGIDWHFLQTNLNPNAHVDYPVLVPLVYVAQALLMGAWPERAIGLITAGFGIATLLVVRGLLADEMPKLARAAATLVLMPLVFSPFIGLAEGPLIAYAVAGLLFIRRGNLTRGAIYLGFAACCKNEGLPIIIAVVIAMMLTRHPSPSARLRMTARLWPMFVIPLPWQILIRAYHLTTTDHIQGGVLERLASRIANPAPVLRALADNPVGNPLFWLGVAAAIAIGWRQVAKERVLAFVALVQPLFFIFVYFITSRDLDWLIHWSWSRIIRQAMPVAALLALFCILPFVIALPHASEPRTDR
jgi:hypothetical protein